MKPPARPDGYPSELERWLTLRDGRRVFVRPVVASDAAQLGRELLRADEETIYQRFFRSPVRLDSEQLARLTDLDYTTRIAIAAFAEDGDGAAIARFEPIGEGAVEVAVVVRPEWRRVGLAAALLAALEEAATSRGIRSLHALYLQSNTAVARALERLGYVRGADDGGVATAVKVLGG